MNTIRLTAALCAVLILFRAPAAAQTTGTITGTVTDASKAVMPGVKVVATLKGPEETREVSTNAVGQYTLPFLAPGQYEITFEAQGFATGVARVTLNVTDRIAVDAALQPSQVSARVEVSASGESSKVTPSGNFLSPHETSPSCFHSLPEPLQRSTMPARSAAALRSFRPPVPERPRMPSRSTVWMP
jgi:hypothetical protein